MAAARLEDESRQVQRDGGRQAGPAAALSPDHPAEVPDFLAAEIGIYE